jgi:hypothetical protein
MLMESPQNDNFSQEEKMSVVSVRQLACHTSKLRRISQVVSTPNEILSYVK